MTLSTFQPSIDWTPERLALVHDAAAALLSKTHQADPPSAGADLYWLQNGPHHAFQRGLEFLEQQLRVERAIDEEDSPVSDARWISRHEREAVADGLDRTVYACIGARNSRRSLPAIEQVRKAVPSSVIALEHFDETLSSRDDRHAFEASVRLASAKSCRVLIYARSSTDPYQLTERLGLTRLFLECSIRIHEYPGKDLLINPTNDELFRRRLATNLSEIKGLRYNGTDDELASELVTLFQRTADEVNSGLISKLPDRGVSELPDEFFIDPVSKLRLPPLPRVPYSGRTAKYGRRLSVEEFIRAEWGDYAKHHLLYADALREIDYSLYKALDYQAHKSRARNGPYSGKLLAEYCEQLGILSREHVVNADPRFHRQVALLERMRAAVRVHKARQRASALLDKIP